MGLFCGNLHFRLTDDKALSAALSRRKITKFRVEAAKNGWTSLYEERVSQQDDDRIRELATGLSKDLHVPCVAFLVHDSDFACYWLVDDGKILDEYNSCPGYFADDDSDEASVPSGGSLDILLRYCQSGTTHDELESLLREETIFAESVIQGLADALGIDQERALGNYGKGGAAADDDDDPDDEDDDDAPRGGPSGSTPSLAGRLSQMLGIKQNSVVADPKVTALVEAAAQDDTATIARLLAEGVDIEAEAPAQLPGSQAMTGQLFPGGPPKIAMTPLIAAIAHKRRKSAEQLLAAGADPNRVHALFGTALHAAAGAGQVEMLRLLIDRGGDVNARNAKGLTLLQALAESRVVIERLAQAQATMKAMGIKVPATSAKLMANVEFPTAGWDACELLLKARNAS